MPLRACDACKSRKVKCDGLEPSTPCSNCRMSNLQCLYFQTPKKRGPKPQESSQQSRSLRGSRPAGIGEPISLNRTNSGQSPSAGSTSSLEPPYAISEEHATSVWMRRTLLRITRQISTDINASIQSLHQNLLMEVGKCVPNLTLEQIITSCIDIHMQSIFPLCPLIHEPSIRANTRLQAPLVTDISALSGPTSGFYTSCLSQEDVASLRSYTLILAICACSAFLMPPESVPNVILVGPVFLNASREMLKLYHDLDIERPNSSSLIIRMFHASALHTDGKIRMAWQVMGEGFRLAEQMRLYEERSFDGLEAVEARLRRVAFWQLYTMDKYAALLEDRPMTLHDFSLPGSMTIKLQDELDVQLLDPITTINSPELEQRFLEGFHTSLRLWATASQILIDLQTLSRFCQCDEKIEILVEAQRMGLTAKYLQFLIVLDDLPISLQSPDTESSADGTSTESQRRSFWVQRVNLLVTYHCLKMILLQRFIDLGLASLLGLRDEGVMLALRKTEIAHDLINVITTVPFESLRANGEACVTKIRRVGATILEVMQQASTPEMISRAKSLFPPLLDVLAKLNSRASDELNKDYIR